MLLCLIILIFAVALIAAIINIRKTQNKKLKLILRIVLSTLITLGIISIAFLGLLAIILTPQVKYHIPFGICLGVFIVFIEGLMIELIWGLFRNKKILYPTLIIGIISIFIFGGTYGYKYYDDNIPTVEIKENLRDYAPYEENTLVAVLDEESTLKITENIPKMDGATALYPVYSAFAKAVYPESELKSDTDVLKCTTTSNAYESIINGEADIIFVASPSKEQEELAREKGVELEFTPIGKEAFVFFVNSKNKLDNITIEQIQKIYSGEITSWKEFGIYNLGNIKAFQREENSGSQTYLEKLMGDIPIKEPETEEILDFMGGIITQVSDYKNYRNAIGYSFRFYSTEMVNSNNIKLLSINGVYPSLENIENGTYPIAGDFYAVTRKDCSNETKLLIEWILSSQGQELIEKTGYTPIK